MQCASHSVPAAGSIACGFAMKPGPPVVSCSHSSVNAAGTSPSQPATTPPSCSHESARQPVVPAPVTRSKQRTVHASRRWARATAPSATVTRAAASRSSGDGSQTASA